MLPPFCFGGPDVKCLRIFTSNPPFENANAMSIFRAASSASWLHHLAPPNQTTWEGVDVGSVAPAQRLIAGTL